MADAAALRVAHAFNATQLPPPTNLGHTRATKRTSGRRPFLLLLTGVSVPPLLPTPPPVATVARAPVVDSCVQELNSSTDCAAPRGTVHPVNPSAGRPRTFLEAALAPPLPSHPRAPVPFTPPKTAAFVA
jgi:hypothetical protein